MQPQLTHVATYIPAQRVILVSSMHGMHSHRSAPAWRWLLLAAWLVASCGPYEERSLPSIAAEIIRPPYEAATSIPSVVEAEIHGLGVYRARLGAAYDQQVLDIHELVGLIKREAAEQPRAVVVVRVAPDTPMSAVTTTLHALMAHTRAPIVLNGPGSSCADWVHWSVSDLGRVSIVVDGQNNTQDRLPPCRIVGG